MRAFLLGFVMIALGATGAFAGDSPLAGKWRIEAVSGAGALDPSKATFEVTPEGQVGSTVGCNRIVGKPKIDGESIAFGPMAGTRMACPPPLDQIEAKYMAALEAARSFRIEGAKLTFVDAQGDALVTLMRVD